MDAIDGVDLRLKPPVLDLEESDAPADAITAPTSNTAPRMLTIPATQICC